MSNKVMWLFIIVIVVLLISMAVGIRRLEKLDAADYEEIEQKLGEEDLQGAFEILTRIVKRHHSGGPLPW